MSTVSWLNTLKGDGEKTRREDEGSSDLFKSVGKTEPSSSEPEIFFRVYPQSVRIQTQTLHPEVYMWNLRRSLCAGPSFPHNAWPAAKKLDILTLFCNTLIWVEAYQIHKMQVLWLWGVGLRLKSKDIPLHWRKNPYGSSWQWRGQESVLDDAKTKSERKQGNPYSFLPIIACFRFILHPLNYYTKFLLIPFEVSIQPKSNKVTW